MSRVATGIVAAGMALVVSASARATLPENQGVPPEDVPPSNEAPNLDAVETTREGRMLPLTLSPRVGDAIATGRVWGGYDGGLRSTVGEAIVEGTLAPFMALRVGASSYDLWGRRTAILGARFGILRQETAPFDLGVGVFYQPQSVRGDGLVTGNVSVGRKIGRVSSFASVGYGQDPEGDDRLASASLGAVASVSRRVHLGIDSRVRFVRSKDKKFDTLAEPTMDFCAGPLLAYSIGGFDIMAQGGIAGLRLDPPRAEASGQQAALHLGSLMLLSVGAAL